MVSQQEFLESEVKNESSLQALRILCAQLPPFREQQKIMKEFEAKILKSQTYQTKIENGEIQRKESNSISV